MKGISALKGKQGLPPLWAGVAFCLGLAGCAGAPGFLSAEKVPAFRDQKMTMEDARDAVATGKSTKADVMAALGAATIVRFDSGFEIWVYRAKPPGATAATPGAAEFVILFAPSGIVKKTRIRPSYE
jgi:hypothetical protein